MKANGSNVVRRASESSAWRYNLVWSAFAAVAVWVVAAWRQERTDASLQLTTLSQSRPRSCFASSISLRLSTRWCKPCLIHVMIHQQKINKQRFFLRITNTNIKNYTNIQLLLCFQSVSDWFHNNYNTYLKLLRSRLWDKCKWACFMRSLLCLFYIHTQVKCVYLIVYIVYLKCV